MAEEFDDSNMSDEDFMAAIEEAGSEPVDNDDYIEDTDQQDEADDASSEEPETNDSDDDLDDDTGFEDDESDEETDEENTQVDEDSSEEEGGVADTDSSEDDAGTDGDKEPETDKIDYKEQYAALQEQNAKLQGFYDEVTSEFVANGKRMKGFDDPKKIIQSQQMAAGFAEKMAAFKEYRPFMSTLKEKGFLDNPDKFNLAMQLIDGDPEAIKKQIKDLDLDPVEMDMENIDYAPKNQVASKIEIAFDDLLENAHQNNVDQEVRNVISKDWDDQSVVALLEDPESSQDLVDHISSGAYNVVQNRIAEKKRVDVNGSYTGKPAIQQYREAANELELEYLQYLQQVENQNAGSQMTEQQYNEQQAVNNRTQQEYAEKVDQKNAQADEARKRATSVSKKKKVVRTKRKDKLNPDNMTDEELTAYLDSIVYTS